MLSIKKQLKEDLLSSSYLYRGKIINVCQDRVKTSAGKITFREIAEHPGAVAILAIDNRKEVILVRQYRQPAGEVLLEIPAGKLEPDEEPLICAQREFVEETGLQAESWEQLFFIYPSPGFCDEKIYLFLAQGLSKAEYPVEADDDENIALEKVKLPEAEKMIRSGTIKDGKTIIAIQYSLLYGN